MSVALIPAVLDVRRPLPRGLRRVAEEVRVVALALVQPKRVLEEVEAMGKLYQRASRAEAHDPELAARLRAQASRIGLN